MKILALSDTHGLHNKIPLEWFNVSDKENTILIHAGDISNMGHLNEIEAFCYWYDKLDFPHKIFCAGNHDFGFQNKPKEVSEIISKYPSITYLQDDFTIINGVKIYCSPWQPYFHNWSFNLKRGQPLQNKWDLIPLDTDILITHGPVYGLVDMTPNGEFVGCQNLLDTIVTKLNNLKAHVSGHIHCAYGHTYKNGVQYINASTLNEMYMVANKPILIDYDIELGSATIIE